MEVMKKYCLLMILIIAVVPDANSQSGCTVKLEAISISYEGACKKRLAHGYGKAMGERDAYEGDFRKGFPHGSGTYKWGDEKLYTGSFAKGMMDGKGELRIFRQDHPDSVLNGYFKEGKYVGKYESPYKVLAKRTVRQVTFQKKNNQVYQVSFRVFHNGKEIRPGDFVITDLESTVTRELSGLPGFDNVNYPLRQAKVNFSIQELQNPVMCEVIFELYEPGQWEILIVI